MTRQANAANGFTLIESIAVIVILSIIAMSAAVIVGQMAESYSDRSVQGQLHVEASVALDRLVREVRSIGNTDDDGETVPDISTATTTSLSWGSGKFLDLNNGNLRLNSDGVNTDTLATDVSALEFDYFDDEHDSLISGSTVNANKIGSIRRVSIDLTLSRAGASENLHTLVFLRSMMLTSDE